ncbi:MAG: NUDIX domain-containing protein [Candidatus Aenigmarchaeota archaeon]|nr:NUDIX domain-containing protein [Candidatus Aenigmarchaeota archaeon]
MPDELLDVFDENNKPINVQKMISEIHRDGLWHRASHIWIYNSKGEILLQLRAEDKFVYPNMWDISAAGHVNANEEPIDSGLREMEEEIGLKVKKEDLNFYRIRKNQAVFRNIKNNEFFYVYFLRFDSDVRGLKLQKEEVQKIRFIPIDELEKQLKENPEMYTPHGDYWADVIKQVKKRLVL